MKFIPAKEYKDLLVQAKALKGINESLEKELEFYRSLNYANSITRFKELQEQVESERQMNHILTNELEEIQKMIK